MFAAIPHYWGLTPKILGLYARQEHLLSLEEAVRKMTSFPAERLGIDDRGRIQENLLADVMVFDPARIDTESTFLRPATKPRGISHVLVNGTPVVLDSNTTDALPVRVL
jgi:N-acyl-D-amino-acid deacylase